MFNLFKRQPITARYLQLEECDAINELERKRFGHNRWTVRELQDFLSVPGNAGLVAIQGVRLLGYCLYNVNLRSGIISIAQVVAHPLIDEYDTITRLLRELEKGIPPGSEAAVNIVINERNLPMQQLLRSFGFICHKILHGAGGNGDDGYFFSLDKPPQRQDAASAS
jgi:hypothetical protein